MSAAPQDPQSFTVLDWMGMVLAGLSALGLLVAALCGTLMGLRQAAPLPQRRAWVVAAFVLGSAGFVLCLVGLYLPIFALAGSIKAD